MARAKKHSVAWTICYVLWDDNDVDEPFTATWFAYGKTKEEAREKFLADFHSHPEDFYGATPETKISVVNVVKGFSC